MSLFSDSPLAPLRLVRFAGRTLRSAGSAAAAEREAARREETTAERLETDRVLHAVAPVAIPADLQLRLRLAVSHERVRAERRIAGRMAHRWHLLRENTLHTFAVQSAVVAVAVLLLGGAVARLGAVTPGQTVEANDIPLIGFSSPYFLYSSSGLHQPIASTDGTPLVVEAMVNAEGRVYDYRVLAGALDAAGNRALRERMLSAVFKPGRVMGEPARGHLVLTFADVYVRG